MKQQTFYEFSNENSIYFAHEKSNTNWISNAHYHNAIEFIVYIKNKVKVFINDELIDLKEGEIAVINPFEVHYFYLEKGSEYWAIRINSKLLDDYYSFCKAEATTQPYIQRLLKDKAKNDAIIQRMKDWELCMNESLQSKITLRDKGFIDLIMGEVISNYPPIYHKYKNRNTDFDVAVLKYISDNFTKEITIKKLSEEFGYNQNVISKKIHKLINQDLRNYVNRLRVFNVGKILKEENNTTLESAAYRSGFVSMSTYYRVASRFPFENMDVEFISQKEGNSLNDESK